MNTYSKKILPARELREYSSLLEGALDLHVHTAPDVFQRAVDDLEFIEVLDEIGYYGYLIKNHFTETASRAHLMSKLRKRTRVLGGIVLNWSVGGLNPNAVDKALSLGAVEVWMPTLDAANHLKVFGEPTLTSVQRIKVFNSSKKKTDGITVLDANGDVKPEVVEILELIAEANAILGTGHLSLTETYKLLEIAKKVGLRKILVTHPEFKATKFSIEDQIKLADLGGIMEHCAVAGYDPKELADHIRRVGINRCIISSDAGQPQKGHPVDVLLKMISDLKDYGFSDSDINRLIKDNPSKLVEYHP
mgnify:CR=1 FL=1